MANVPGHPKLVDIRIPGPKASIAFVKFAPAPNSTPLQEVWKVRNYIASQSPKTTPIGGGELWAAANRKEEDRSVGKIVNRAMAFAHRLRERAGLPSDYMEHGCSTKLVQGDYRRNRLQVSMRGVPIATISGEEADDTVWHLDDMDKIFLACSGQYDRLQVLSDWGIYFRAKRP